MNDFVDNTMYTMENIDYLKYYYNGLTVWTRNAMITDSPFKNFEKATIANFRPNPANGNLEMIIRRANGQEVPLKIEPRDDPSEYVEEVLFFSRIRKRTSRSAIKCGQPSVKSGRSAA
ncbi:hypothetical protein ACFTAO_21550 [Paenibacillus rhizoplanae]